MHTHAIMLVACNKSSKAFPLLEGREERVLLPESLKERKMMACVEPPTGTRQLTDHHLTVSLEDHQSP